MELVQELTSQGKEHGADAGKQKESKQEKELEKARRGQQFWHRVLREARRSEGEFNFGGRYSNGAPRTYTRSNDKEISAIFEG